MSDNTLNYSFILPEVDGSDDQWGDMLNQNWSDLDTLLKAQEDATSGLQGGVNTLQGDVNTLEGRTLTAGNGLTGGGDLSSNRTFTLGTPSTLSGSTDNSVSGSSHTHAIDSTVSRTDPSTSTLLAAAAMDSHRTSGDHDSRYARLTGGADADFSGMPRVGGDPIVESGSNSDGNWTRWADGTQICSGISQQVNNYPASVGGVYRSDNVAMLFAASFTGPPSCSFSTQYVTGGAWAWVGAEGAPGTNGVSTRVFTMTDDSGVRVVYVATGRWK